LAGLGDSVYWISPNGEVPILQGLHKIVSIALTADHTALIADSGANQIHRVRHVTGTPESDIVAGSKEGIGAPVAVAMSRDGKRAFVANSKSGIVTIVDLQARTAVDKLSCGCKPTGLDRLAGQDVFRLTGPSKQPMWVLEAATHQSRILFVPPDLTGSSHK
jgi:sugar lactone lactonase YvrE